MLNYSFFLRSCSASTCVHSTLLALVVGIWAATSPAQALTITVRQDGTGDYNTIQAGLDAAATGDQVIVGEGVYRGLGNCNLTFRGKSIALNSSSGADGTIIDGGNRDRAFVFAAGEAGSIKGFTIRNCFAAQGGAIYCEGSPRILYCKFFANRASDGSAIYIAGGQPRLEVSTVQNNLAAGAGGSAISIKAGTPIIKYCVIAGNQGDAVTMNSGLGAQFFACTIADNSDYSLRRGTAIVTGIVKLTDCILRDRLSPDWLTSELVATHSDILAGWPGEGNIDADPMFLSQGDYDLRAGSPCIDAGSVEGCRMCPIIYYPWYPGDGDGDGIDMSDMGGLEYYPGALLVLPRFIWLKLEPGGTADRIIELRNPGPLPVQWTAAPSAPWLQVTPSSGLIEGNTELLTLSVSTAALPPGTYDATVTIADTINSMYPLVVSVKLFVPNVLRVPSQYPNIQVAIDASTNGDVILVAPGTYTGLGNQDVHFKSKAVTVRSEGGASATIIDARPIAPDISYNVFEFEAREPSTAVLDGLTIVNYNRHAVYCVYSGPTIQNCIFAGNPDPAYPGTGAALYGANASPTMVNCEIRDHRGAYIYSSRSAVETSGTGTLTLRDCYLYRNGGSTRGAMYATAPLLLDRCRITENESPQGAAAIFSSTDLTVSDSIIDANSGSSVLEVSGKAAITNSRICGNNAAAVFCQADLTLTNCTLAYNSERYSTSRIINYAGGDLQVYNSILWGDANSRSVSYRPSVTLQPSLFFSDVCNLDGPPSVSPFVGSGVISADPRFVNPNGPDGDRMTWQDNDYRLAPDSPCANRGSDLVPQLPATDLAGERRTQFCHVDMGAYELGEFVDCNGNSAPDSCDIVDGLESDCNANFVPDSCESDSDSDKVIDACDTCANTIPNAPVDSSGCPALIPGDHDRDGDVDDQDLNRWLSCGTGPTPSTLPPGCDNADFDLDSDVDQSDFGVIQRCLSGQDSPADPQCK